MSYTLTEAGEALTETREGVTMPVDFSFAAVNDYVHGVDRIFEELQWLCLGMASEMEELRKDAERYRWLRERLMGADFDWDGSGACVIAFGWPEGSPVSANCDRSIDEAMLGKQKVDGHREGYVACTPEAVEAMLERIVAEG